jgi:hypothetical protein
MQWLCIKNKSSFRLEMATEKNEQSSFFSVTIYTLTDEKRFAFFLWLE